MLISSLPAGFHMRAGFPEASMMSDYNYKSSEKQR